MNDSKAGYAKKMAWKKQGACLGSPLYRVTLRGRRDNLASFNLGRQRKATEEKFFTAEDINAKIPFLSAKNYSGYDVYITPIDEKHHYLVIDDVEQKKIEALKHRRGAGAAEKNDYQFCLIQKSSSDNYQFIIKAEKSDNQKGANDLVAALNNEYGDPRFRGAIHPFRMAGFSNKKLGKENEITTVIEGEHRICAEAGRQINELNSNAKQSTRRPAKSPVVVSRPIQVAASSEAVKAYKTALREVRGLVMEKGWAIDESRMDYRACQALLKKGYSQSETMGALEIASPNLAERHHNTLDYSRRTVQKANESLQPKELSR